MSGLATKAIVLIHVRALAGLAGVPEVDELVASVLAAVHGAEGLDADQLARLGQWSNRWSVLPAAVREFYAVALADQSVARWAVFAGIRSWLSGVTADRRVRGMLENAHCELMGCDAEHRLVA